MRVKFDRFGSAWPPSANANRGGFTDPEKRMLQEALDGAVACSTDAMVSMNHEFFGKTDLVEAYFARPQDMPRLKAGLKKVHDVLTSPSMTVTFVDARGQSEKLLRQCDRAVPGIPGRESHGAMENHVKSVKVVPMGPGDYAYVKNLRETDPDAKTEAHAGSGFRVYIGERGFHPSKVARDRIATVYHELSHKILATIDHAYGVVNCLALADTDRAISCADNWSYFVTGFRYAWPGFNWDPNTVVTRPRSNAISGPRPGGVQIVGHRDPR